MHNRSLIVTLLILFCVLLNNPVLCEAYPAVDMGRINSIPDLLQTHWKGHFDLGGLFHCAPVAASNSLAWFYLSGYRDLLPGVKSLSEEQIELAKKLGSSSYMQTDPYHGGTTIGGVIRGIDKYLSECDYRRSRLIYAGWERVKSDPFPRHVPDMEFIKNGFEKAGSVLLNLGWYIYDPNEDTYFRESGHWVTLVGYGLNINGRQDPHTLVIHDPAPWAGKGFQNHFVQFEPIEKGVFRGPFRGLPVKAEGFLVARQGLLKPNERVLGIIEGAVVIKMEIQFPFAQ